MPKCELIVLLWFLLNYKMTQLFMATDENTNHLNIAPI